MGITDEQNCNCQADKSKKKINNSQNKSINERGHKEIILFAPFKGKMKVLKKIKKRMGLGQYNKIIIIINVYVVLLAYSLGA